jgi:hypothetical protein
MELIMFKVNGQTYTHQEMEATNRDDVEFLEWLATAQPGSTWTDGETVECIADVPAVSDNAFGGHEELIEKTVYEVLDSHLDTTRISEVERLRARNAELVTALQKAHDCLAFLAFVYADDAPILAEIHTALKGD